MYAFSHNRTNLIYRSQTFFFRVPWIDRNPVDVVFVCGQKPVVAVGKLRKTIQGNGLGQYLMIPLTKACTCVYIRDNLKGVDHGI